MLLSGGFGSYLLGLNKTTYEQAGVDTEGNAPGSYKEPQLGWMIGFLFVVSFVGVLALVPLRKVCIFFEVWERFVIFIITLAFCILKNVLPGFVLIRTILGQIMIIDYQLPYPSGTATAVLINGFHTTKGNVMAE